MSNLTSADKKYLDNALRLDSGFLIRFSDETFHEFFAQFNIDIDDPKYAVNGSSKAKKMETFWQIENNQIVGMAILELAAMFRNIELGQPLNIKFSVDVEKIGQKLLSIPDIKTIKQSAQASIKDNLISLEIRPEIYEHIKSLLNSKHYFNAVEEAYKIVREKLNSVAGSEKATDLFDWETKKLPKIKPKYCEKIFGSEVAESQIEDDFRIAVGYLLLVVQFLRNEKSHTKMYDLNPNLAIHYLTLASLAYDLISRNESSELPNIIHGFTDGYVNLSVDGSVEQGGKSYGKGNLSEIIITLPIPMDDPRQYNVIIGDKPLEISVGIKHKSNKVLILDYKNENSKDDIPCEFSWHVKGKAAK